MKKAAAVLAVVVMVVSLVSPACAGSGLQTVTIKTVDAKAGTIVYIAEDGKDMTMNVDKSVDLNKVKNGEKVKIMVERDMVTSMTPARPKAAAGC